jgi:hypothetical protein
MEYHIIRQRGCEKGSEFIVCNWTKLTKIYLEMMSDLKTTTCKCTESNKFDMCICCRYDPVKEVDLDAITSAYGDDYYGSFVNEQNNDGKYAVVLVYLSSTNGIKTFRVTETNELEVAKKYNEYVFCKINGRKPFVSLGYLYKKEGSQYVPVHEDGYYPEIEKKLEEELSTMNTLLPNDDLTHCHFVTTLTIDNENICNSLNCRSW